MAVVIGTFGFHLTVFSHCFSAGTHLSRLQADLLVSFIKVLLLCSSHVDFPILPVPHPAPVSLKNGPGRGRVGIQPSTCEQSHLCYISPEQAATRDSLRPRYSTHTHTHIGSPEYFRLLHGVLVACVS